MAFFEEKNEKLAILKAGFPEGPDIYLPDEYIHQGCRISTPENLIELLEKFAIGIRDTFEHRF